jgi:glutathione S-transferase
MKLYGDMISPFVRMTMVTAHEVGLAGKIERSDAKVDPTTANKDLARHSPLAKIPVLLTEHGHALYDSRVIIEYLCHISGNKTLIPDDGVKRFRILTLEALAQGIAESAVGYRYETVSRPKGLQWQGWLDRNKVRIDDALDDLEANWNACLAEVNAGSICTAAALAYIDFRIPDWGWRNGRPKLAAFQEDFSNRDSMVKTKLH